MNSIPIESEVRNVNLLDGATHTPPAADTTATGVSPASRESGLPETDGWEVRPGCTRDRRVATGGVTFTGKPSVSAQSTATALIDILRGIADPDAVPLIPTL